MDTYERKYKEAQKWIESIYPNLSHEQQMEAEAFFPNLRENEDERISKEIIKYLERTVPHHHRDEVLKSKEWTAWLEKQGEQNPYSDVSFEYNGHIFGMCARDGGAEILMDGNLKAFVSLDKSVVYPVIPIPVFKAENFYVSKVDGQIHDMTYNPVNNVEPKFKVGDIMRTLQEANDGYTDGMPVVVSIDNEYYHCTNELIAIKDQDCYEFPPINVKQKPDEKIDSKFHKGDWVVCGKFVTQITSIENDGYTNSDQGFISFETAKKFHLWTIKDAKEGDVLAYVTDEEDLWIMIYWSLYEPYEGHVHYHALLVNDNFSDKGTCCISINDLKPATKEQRDLLFAKMKEAGYEWDAENKELKKIHIIDEGKAEMDYCFTKMMNGEKVSQTWNEEDEKTVHNIDAAIRHEVVFPVDELKSMKIWLESLKYRIRPRHEQLKKLKGE